MSHSLTIPIKCVNTFFDFLHVVDAVSEYINSDQNSVLQTANVINRLALFGFSTQEIKKLICNPSNNQALASLKSSELGYRYMTLVVQLFKGTRDSNETELQFLDRAVIAPLADIVRVSSERSAYEIKHCLQSSLVQHEATPSTDSLQTIIESREKIKALEERIQSAFRLKLASELGLVVAAGDIYKTFYINFFSSLGIDPSQYRSQELEDVIMNSYPIPSVFHEDVVFSRYVCAITLEPIRYPVEDPTTQRLQNANNNPTLYEKSAIINCLAIRPSSPITREPLTPDQLIERPDIQNIIEDRLVYHTSQLSRYFATSSLLQENLQVEPTSS